MEVLLKPESTAVKCWGIDCLVYITAISDYTVSSTGRVFSEYSVSTLRKKLKYIPILEVRKSLDNLEKLGLVSLEGIRIQLGEDSDLYGNGKIDTDSFKHENDVLNRLKALRTARVRGVDTERYYRMFRALQQEPMNKSESYLKLYECIYFAIFEEEPTHFSQKEKGQMTHMLKFYGKTNHLKNMIYEYIKNSVKYSKDYTSIGGLLFSRHRIDTAVKGKTPRALIGDDKF